MARTTKNEQNSTESTTSVNIADFQRTRDTSFFHIAAVVMTTHPGATSRVFYESVIHRDLQFCLILEQTAELIDRITASLNRASKPATTVPPTDASYQVIVALATLQSSVQDLSRAYINHANTVLNPGSGGRSLDIGVTSVLLENGLLGSNPQRSAGDIEAKLEDASGEAKKKRKRAPHDPNAPKRALTPYFLYMQTARPIIAKELGEHAKPKEVADEGTRRWAAMKEPDKRTWTTQYAHNLAIYREKMKAYKAGQPVPDDDQAAKQLQSGPAEAAALEDVEPEVDDDEDEDEEEEEPVKEPTPPPKSSAKRRKTDKATPAAAPTPAKEVASTPAKKASPVKEKKKTRKEEAAEKVKKSIETPKAAAEADKKKKSKKRKSEAVVDDE